MKLGVNIVRLTRSFTGVGRYIECLLNEWARTPQPFDEIVLYTPAPIAQERVTFPLDKFRVEVLGKPAPDPVWEYRQLRRAAKHIDVLFCPSYTLPLGYRGRCAVTYLGPSENRPGTREWFRSRAYDALYRYSARRADHVFACSRAVKRRLTDVYGVPAERVSVTWLAASEHFHPVDDPEALRAMRLKHGLGDAPYILFVGKLARRHYIPELLTAFSRLHQRPDIPHRLVIAGPDYLGLDVPGMASRLGIGESVTWIPFVEHRELPVLYSGAKFFVFPASAAEGFGIPVAEAMACGTAVITTRAGSLPEFADGVALFSESSGVSELERAMERLALDAPLREQLARRGPDRAAGISWKITAEKTMAVLQRLAQRSAS